MSETGKHAFFNGRDGNNPGTRTDLSQHFLLVKVQGHEIKDVMQMLDLAHVKFQENDRRGGFPSVTTLGKEISENMNDPAMGWLPMVKKRSLGRWRMQIYPKPQFHHVNYWAKFALDYCRGGKVEAWTHHPDLEDKLEKVIDFRKPHLVGARAFLANRWEPGNNHMKLGRCLRGNMVGISGWNHGSAQVERGSIFVAIESKGLHRSFTQLFNSKQK